MKFWNMHIEYTYHALEQIKERKIHFLWVEEAIKYADITYREGHKYYASKKFNGRTLKIVYVKENYIKVITTFWIK